MSTSENITLDIDDSSDIERVESVDENEELEIPEIENNDDIQLNTTVDVDNLYGDSDDENTPPPPPSKDDRDEESEEEEIQQENQEEGEEEEETDEQKDKIIMNKFLDMNIDEEDDEDDEDSDYDEDYLQKLDNSVKKNIISNYHPELLQHKNEEVETLCKVVRNEDNIIIDPFHKTIPFLTKYEKARVLGERAKQINAGASPFVNIEPSIIDGYLIAQQELNERKIPFIIKRPITNGGCEYWKLEDLEMLF